MASVTPIKLSESEWRTGLDVSRLFRHVYPKGSARKLRLFSCAACHQLRSIFHDTAVSNAFDVAEANADGCATREELVAARLKAGWDFRPRYLEVGLSGNEIAFAAHDLATRPQKGATLKAAWFALYSARQLGLRAYRADGYNGWWDESQADLLRDIFGNPFSSIAFAPEWRSAAAVGLAESMYASRDFGPMPILADALEEAGCDHADVLAHCRGDGPHVRGCWVVDLVLGKS